MYPKSSSSSPAKPAIDRDFYERLNQLARAPGPLDLSGKIPDSPKPVLTIGIVKPSPLPSPGYPAADLASSAPKLALSPKIRRMSDSVLVGQDACPCPDNQNPVSVVSVTPLALKASGGGRAGKNGRSASPSPRNHKAKDESRRSSPRISPASSPAPSPRGQDSLKSTVVSVSLPTTSAASSAETSPATTPRGEGSKGKLSGARKLQRKLTQKAEDIANAVREVLNGQTSRSRASSGERSSPKTMDSPQVKFGSVDLVDMKVALDDPNFNAFVNESAHNAFAKPWVNDKADTAGRNAPEPKNIDKLRPTFIRDFHSSQYFCRDEMGKWVKLTSTDEFIDYVGKGADGYLPEVVSNYASQNIGIFLKHALFQRRDAQQKLHSVLKLNDGTPIIPQANGRASYRFSRDASGKLTMDYSWRISADTNPGKPIFARIADDSRNLIEVSEEAKLEIKVSVTFEPDGNAHISDPRVHASGWKKIEFTV